MICEKCGAHIPEGSQVCPGCGVAPEGQTAADDMGEGLSAPVEEQVTDGGEEAASIPAEEKRADDEGLSGPTEEHVTDDEGLSGPVEEPAVADAAGEGTAALPEGEAPTETPVGEELPAAEDLTAPDGEDGGYRPFTIEADGEEEAPPAPPKKKRTGLIVGVAIAAVVVVAAAVALCVHFAGRSADPADKVLELVECLPDNETDVALETIGVPGDTVMLTVNGQDVTAEEYLYWLGNITSYYDMISSYGGAPMDLTQEAQDGVTWDQQLKLAARDNTVLLALTPSLAEEYGAELTDEDLQMVADNRAESIESIGGEAMYAYQLQAMGISDATALRLDATTALYSKFQAAWLDRAAEALTAEEVAAYAEENDLLRAKHILLLTKDMTTGEALSDEEIAQKRAKADELLAQLRAEPDKFDELMNANSEDTGLESNPDGYLFTAGDMVAEFEEGTRALEVGGISEVIESDYGYHIILRLDPDCDESRQTMVSDRFSEAVQAAVDEAEVVEHEVYNSFTTADYYEKLTAFQEALPQPESESEPDVTDQSQAELQPDTASGS